MHPILYEMVTMSVVLQHCIYNNYSIVTLHPLLYVVVTISVVLQHCISCSPLGKVSKTLQSSLNQITSSLHLEKLGFVLIITTKIRVASIKPWMRIGVR